MPAGDGAGAEQPEGAGLSHSEGEEEEEEPQRPEWLPEEAWQQARRRLRLFAERQLRAALEDSLIEQEISLLSCLHAIKLPDRVAGVALNCGDEAAGDEEEEEKSEKLSPSRTLAPKRVSHRAFSPWGLERVESLPQEGSRPYRLGTTVANLFRPKSGVEQLEDLMLFRRHVKEPERKGFLVRVLKHPLFEPAVLAVIILNVIATVHRTNHLMMDTHTEPAGGRELDVVLECFFLGFFTLELLLRLIVHRFYFFFNSQWAWNVADLLFLVQAFVKVPRVDLYIFRVLRLFDFEVTKDLRRLPLLRFSRELRLLTSILTSSMRALFWSLILLSCFLCLFSLFFVQSVRLYIEDGRGDPGTVSELLLYFGSVEGGIVSLLMAATGGEDWSSIHKPLTRVGSIVGAAFIFFVVFFTLAAMNIVTSMFVDKAMQISKPDSLELIDSFRAEDSQRARELLDLCAKFADGAGTIKRDVFCANIESQDGAVLLEHFQLHGLCFPDANGFFDILTAGTPDRDALQLHAFVEACLALRKSTPVVSLQMLQHQNHTMHRRLVGFQRSCYQQFKAIGSAMEASPPRMRSSSLRRNTRTSTGQQQRTTSSSLEPPPGAREGAAPAGEGGAADESLGLILADISTLDPAPLGIRLPRSWRLAGLATPGATPKSGRTSRGSPCRTGTER